MQIYVSVSLISIFSLFVLVFNDDFVMYVGFIHIAVLDTATYDVTN